MVCCGCRWVPSAGPAPTEGGSCGVRSPSSCFGGPGREVQIPLPASLASRPRLVLWHLPRAHHQRSSSKPHLQTDSGYECSRGHPHWAAAAGGSAGVTARRHQEGHPSSGGWLKHPRQSQPRVCRNQAPPPKFQKVSTEHRKAAAYTRSTSRTTDGRTGNSSVTLSAESYLR